MKQSQSHLETYPITHNTDDTQKTNKTEPFTTATQIAIYADKKSCIKF